MFIHSLAFGLWVCLSALSASQEIYSTWLKQNDVENNFRSAAILNEIDQNHIFVVQNNTLKVFPKDNLSLEPEVTFTVDGRLCDVMHKKYVDSISGTQLGDDYNGILLLRLKDGVKREYGDSSFVSFTVYDSVKKRLKVSVSNGKYNAFDASEQYLQGLSDQFFPYYCTSDHNEQISLSSSSTVPVIIADRKNLKFYKILKKRFGIPYLFQEMQFQKNGDDTNLNNFIRPQFIETNKYVRITGSNFLKHCAFGILIIIFIQIDICLRALVFYTPLVLITPNSWHASLWYEGFFCGTYNYLRGLVQRK